MNLFQVILDKLKVGFYLAVVISVVTSCYSHYLSAQDVPPDALLPGVNDSLVYWVSFAAQSFWEVTGVLLLVIIVVSFIQHKKESF